MEAESSYGLLKGFKSPLIPLYKRGKLEASLSQRGKFGASLFQGRKASGHLFQRENPRGFTLIEILISVIVLVIALVPMAGVITRSLGSNVEIEYANRTAFLAQLKIEETKTLLFAYFDRNYSETAKSFPHPNNNFKYTIEDDGDPIFKNIKVTVWYDRNGTGNSPDSGEERTVLYTKVAKRGET